MIAKDYQQPHFADETPKVPMTVTRIILVNRRRPFIQVHLYSTWYSAGQGSFPRAFLYATSSLAIPLHVTRRAIAAAGRCPRGQ